MKDQSELLREVKAGISAQLNEVLSNVKNTAHTASIVSNKELEKLAEYIDTDEDIDKEEYKRRISQIRDQIESNLNNVVTTAGTSFSAFSQPIGVPYHLTDYGFISQIPIKAIDFKSNCVIKDKISKRRFAEGVRKGFFNTDGTLTDQGKQGLRSRQLWCQIIE